MDGHDAGKRSKRVKETLETIENSAIDVIAVFAPWLGPVPSAYLVWRACINYLHWAAWVAWVAAIAVESIGVVSVVQALRLYDWNQTRTQKDAEAPFNLSVALVAIYFIVTIGLTVLLDVLPDLARYAPAIFPFLAAVGAVNIAIKNGQRRREAEREGRKHARAKPEPARKEETGTSGNLPPGQITDWRVLPLGDKQKVAGMETSEIQNVYGVSARTARNWRKNARQLSGEFSANGHVKEGE
jgi:hypothetical protein